MRKKLLLITATVFCLGVSYSFASEKHCPESNVKVGGFTFMSALLESSDAGIVLLKSNREKKEIAQNGFFDWISRNEKTLLTVAIVSTVIYGALFLTGIICMGAGWSSWASGGDMGAYYAYCAGGALFGLSWFAFLVAGTFWAFWGIAQYLKKNGYEARPIIESSREKDRDEPSNLSCKIGLSVSFH